MSAWTEKLAWMATRLSPVPVLYLWPPARRIRMGIRGGGRQDDPSDRLTALLLHAVKTVPYYRERYAGRVKDSTDIEIFDFIDRQIMADHFDQLISETAQAKDFEIGTTGGTSGSPLKLLIPKKRYLVEWGTMFSLWERAGYRGQARAVLRNHRILEGDVRSRPLTREVLFDNFRLSDDYLGRIYEIMERRRIAFLHAYPSAAYRFAAFVEKEKLTLHHLRVVLSGSENLYPRYRQLIQDRLGLRFYNWYGHAERLVLGGYCQGSELYHIEPGYGHFELLDESGRPVDKEGDWGEIVGTTLNNYGMPLIRYRTGDFARYAGGYCPSCGRTLPLLTDIRGRWSGDRVYRRDGSFITTTALNLHDEALGRIHGLQYEQERPGQLKVSIVPGPGFSERTAKELLALYQYRMGEESEVSVVVVSELQRRPNGKFLLLHRGLDL